MIAPMWFISISVLPITSSCWPPWASSFHDMMTSPTNQVHSWQENINCIITHSICVFSCEVNYDGTCTRTWEKWSTNCADEHCRDQGMAMLSTGTVQCIIREGSSRFFAMWKLRRQWWKACSLRMHNAQGTGNGDYIVEHCKEWGMTLMSTRIVQCVVEVREDKALHSWASEGDKGGKVRHCNCVMRSHGKGDRGECTVEHCRSPKMTPLSTPTTQCAI